MFLLNLFIYSCAVFAHLIYTNQLQPSPELKGLLNLVLFMAFLTEAKNNYWELLNILSFIKFCLLFKINIWINFLMFSR